MIARGRTLTTSDITKELLSRLGTGSTASDIAKLFGEACEWNIPGDKTAFPWIGKMKGREAVESFVRDTRLLLEPILFDVQGVITNEERGVILGYLESRVRATSKIIKTSFAIILTVAEDQITSFTMLEDSFAVSSAAKELMLRKD